MLSRNYDKIILSKKYNKSLSYLIKVTFSILN